MKTVLVTTFVPQLHNAFFVQARSMSSKSKVCALIVGMYQLSSINHYFPRHKRGCIRKSQLIDVQVY